MALDMTCVSMRVSAPDIKNGYVAKYDRQNENGKNFLVAVYLCDDNYELENSSINSLYCSDLKWIGVLPKCEGHDYEANEDYEENDNLIELHDSKESKLFNEEQFSPGIEQNHVKYITINETQYPLYDRILSSKIFIKQSDENVDAQCPLDNNCEHSCNVVVNPEKNAPWYICLCNAGYSLNDDKLTCTG